MRYEYIEMHMTTAACAELQTILQDSSLSAELENLNNELCARLQRRDPDPKSPMNAVATAEDWLTT